jgi:hypothetical protein
MHAGHEKLRTWGVGENAGLEKWNTWGNGRPVELEDMRK